MSDNEITAISKSLQIIARLMASIHMSLNFGEASNKEKIAALDGIGFSRHEIAQLLLTTVGTVAKELSLMRTAHNKDDKQ